MIELAGSMVVVVLTVAMLSALAAIVAALARRRAAARRCGLAALLSLLGFIPTCGMLVLGSGSSSESKAALLARGISEAMNAEAIALPVLLIAVACWLVVKRRARRPDEREDA